MLIQFLFVIVAIIIGARMGGIGLGVMGGLGLSFLVFIFGLEPTSPPIAVMLMIVAVISAASCMQAAGGLDYLVKPAEKLLRNNPSKIVWLSPLVTYLFTVVAGTGHIAYSILPVISEVATETKIRPERPLSIAVVASQQGITSSPISAATVALLGLFVLNGIDITLLDILIITVPATIIGILVGAFACIHKGKELENDPEFQRRVRDGVFTDDAYQTLDVKDKKKAIISIIIFVLATLLIVVFGSVDALKPTYGVGDAIHQLSMDGIIEIFMLSAAALILLLTKTDAMKVNQSSVFVAGMQAVIAIFGIAWMGDTFIQGNMEALSGGIKMVVTDHNWLFGVALFAMSILLNSQAATVLALMPLALNLGLEPHLLIALFPAVNGYFFIPNYPPLVAAINFDRTGTTKIGKYVLNHSFMLPGLVTTFTTVCVGLLMVYLIY